MSDVKRYTESCMEGGGVAESREGEFVAYTDFDAEHALRLEAEEFAANTMQRITDLLTREEVAIARAVAAERQVGELREQFATQRNHFREQLRDAKKADVLQAKLDTAIGLLRDCLAGELFGPDGWETVNTFVNGSPAPKVCECGPLRNITEGGHFPACTRCHRRLKANTTSTEGKDHE